MIKLKRKEVWESSPMNGPMVSVIVPTYNRVQLLQGTVDTILSQTFDDFELIIVDNMSEDGTEEYVNGLEDPRIKFYRNSNDGIIAVNRNFGIKRAKGKYIAFCDDDDLWLPHKLLQQINFMEENTDVGLCSGYGAAIDLRGEIQRFPEKDSMAFECYDFNSLLKCNRIKTSTVMVRATCIKSIGGFDEDPDLVGIEDFDLWLIIARDYKIVRIPFVLAKQRRHSGNTSQDRVKMNSKVLKVLRKYEDMGYVDGKTASGLKGVVYRKLFVRACLQRDSGARRYAMESIKQSFDVRNYIYYLMSWLPVPWGFHVFRLFRRVLMIKGFRLSN